MAGPCDHGSAQTRTVRHSHKNPLLHDFRGRKKKADVEGFIQRFTERWIYGLIHHAAQHDILQWVDDEPMMVHWLRQYCGLDEQGLQAARDRRKDAREEFRELERQLQQDG